MSDRLQGRVRFIDCKVGAEGDGLSARVTLATADNRVVVGTATRASGDAADLWCVADATAAALEQVLQREDITLEIKDVVAFEIDESPAVAAALRSTVAGDRRKLFGLCKAEADSVKAAALAVLSSTNRFFSDS